MDDPDVVGLIIMGAAALAVIFGVAYMLTLKSGNKE